MRFLHILVLATLIGLGMSRGIQQFRSALARATPRQMRQRHGRIVETPRLRTGRQEEELAVAFAGPDETLIVSDLESILSQEFPPNDNLIPDFEQELPQDFGSPEDDSRSRNLLPDLEEQLSLDIGAPISDRVNGKISNGKTDSYLEEVLEIDIDAPIPKNRANGKTQR